MFGQGDDEGIVNDEVVELLVIVWSRNAMEKKAEVGRELKMLRRGIMKMIGENSNKSKEEKEISKKKKIFFSEKERVVREERKEIKREKWQFIYIYILL